MTFFVSALIFGATAVIIDSVKRLHKLALIRDVFWVLYAFSLVLWIFYPGSLFTDKRGKMLFHITMTVIIVALAVLSLMRKTRLVVILGNFLCGILIIFITLWALQAAHVI